MKNYEVAIIVGVIAVIGYFWYKNSEGTPIQQPIPTGGVRQISFLGGPLKGNTTVCCIAPGGVLLQPTCMYNAPTTLEMP